MPRGIGCDLSRAVPDLHGLPSGVASHARNDPDAIAARVASLEPDGLVGSAASSGCDGPPLAARGPAVPWTDPRQARAFARATGVLARTDVDARVLARMGTVLDLPITVPSSPARSRLSDFLGRRRQPVEIRKAGKTRRHDARQDEIARRGRLRAGARL